MTQKLGGDDISKIYMCKIPELGDEEQFVTKVRDINMDIIDLNSGIKEAYFEYQFGKYLKHHNIIEYKYFVKQDGQIHIIMDKIHGTNLSNYITD